jgi:hypothetical protein
VFREEEQELKTLSYSAVIRILFNLTRYNSRQCREGAGRRLAQCLSAALPGTGVRSSCTTYQKAGQFDESAAVQVAVHAPYVLK